MSTITTAILVISAVAVSGLVFGSVRIRGIGLGPAGVLFAGILFGHFGATINPEINHFAKEFGLILFVFTIGIQLGPGIIQLWKQQGLLLNGLTLLIVLQGFALVALFGYLFGFPGTAVAGLFCGSTTNTPSLGAAEQAASMLAANESGIDIGFLASAYAVAYPGGIIGIIASMLLLKKIFRVNLDDEVARYRELHSRDREKIERQSVVVENSRLDLMPFGQIPGINETGVRISRIKRAGDNEVEPATEQTLLGEGDIVQVVGPKSGLARFVPLIGRPSEEDLMAIPGKVTYRRVFVTETHALNRSLAELSLDRFYNVTVTRIIRGGIEMAPRGSSRLFYGDIVQVVGDIANLDRVTAFLGNSTKSMKETQFSPLFVGIAIGVLAGLIPLSIPGVPFPVRLGLAGGPLIAAIVLSLVGSIGSFVWYIPSSANLALRELGIILFLACAGLGAGETFFHSAMSLDGVIWMGTGLVITMLPLLTAGILARVIWKQNSLTICGVIAGSMTDPPALAFAGSMRDCDASATAYAAVYPLTMILRIIVAQSLIFIFA
ncbi:MAG: putative transporter [Planctomycetales bacterium]|nr:putative transporter [Planctomycetales bacterium]